MPALRNQPWQALTVPFLVALLIRFYFSWLSHGQAVVDVASFEHWAMQLDAGNNPYRSATNPANYPPLWVYLCWVCLAISRWTPLTFDLAVKLLVSTFDSATVFPVGFLAGRLNSNTGRRAALVYAVNPVSILIASFHAQNDPVVIGLLMWAIWLVISVPFRHAIELGMLCVGVSLCIKPVGVLFLPLIWMSFGGWARRAVGGILVGLPMLVTALPYLVSSPVELIGSAGTYRGPPDFGYVGIYNAWMNLGHGSSGEPIIKSLPVGMRLAYIVVFGAVWWRFRRAPLLEQVRAVLLSLYLFYGALGAQYLVWIVPIAAALVDRYLTRSSIAAAVALLAFYQLNHHAILSGTTGVQWKTGIAIPQWTGILLIAQAGLYLYWLRWFRDLLRADSTDPLIQR